MCQSRIRMARTMRKRTERSLQVVAQVFRIAEVEAGPVMVVEKPERQRNQAQQKRECVTAIAADTSRVLRLRLRLVLQHGT